MNTITEFSKPPRGYKNIDLAKSQFVKLEDAVKRCDETVPALVFSSTRWLENSFYSREIIEDEYNERMQKIKDQTRIFIGDCSCKKM